MFLLVGKSNLGRAARRATISKSWLFISLIPYRQSTPIRRSLFVDRARRELVSKVRSWWLMSRFTMKEVCQILGQACLDYAWPGRNTS